MVARAIPQVAFEIAKDKETLVLFAYDDAHFPPKETVPSDVIQGTLTAGYGHTGPSVQIGMEVTQARADAWLADDLNRAADRLEAKIGADVIAILTDNQYAALLDFVFNLGIGDPKKPEWTIWKRLKAREFDQVPLEMAKFVNATVGGKLVKLGGLVDRRNAEIGLWAVNEPGSAADSVPSSVTRSTPTPPTPAAPGRSKALIFGAAGAVASAGPTIDRVSDAMQRYSGHSHYVDLMLAGLATGGAICAAVAIFYTQRQARNARN